MQMLAQVAAYLESANAKYKDKVVDVLAVDPGLFR